MQLSIEEVKKLDSNSYQIIDIRSEEEVAHGAIKGALNIQAEEIELDERVPHDKKLVIVCSRGKTSVDVAEYLTEKGFDAASLKGGYISWLLDAMKEDEVAERDVKADVEQSIRKKFKKSIWRKFTKAINTYELVKPGDKIAVCISGGKDSMLMAKLFQELKHHNKTRSYRPFPSELILLYLYRLAPHKHFYMASQIAATNTALKLLIPHLDHHTA